MLCDYDYIGEGDLKNDPQKVVACSILLLSSIHTNVTSYKSQENVKWTVSNSKQNWPTYIQLSPYHCQQNWN